MTLRRFVKKIFYGDKNIKGEIDPDQIFLDSSNLPKFDNDQFEGRLERPITKLTFIWISVFFVAVGLIFTGRLWFLQVENGEAYEERSQNNHLRHTTIFANRGLIFDRKGERLVWNELNPNEEFSLRKYTRFSGMAHILGFVRYPAKDKWGIYYSDEFVPNGGVEEYFNDVVSGKNGLKITETDAHNEVQSESTLTMAKDGGNLTLSIDSAIQNKLYELMSTSVKDRGFEGGAGVVIDIYSGEIIAITSFPEFSPNIMTAGEDKDIIRNFLNDGKNAFLNRAISGQFIPGSIMKPFIAVGVLEEGVIDPLKEIFSPGYISVPNPYDPSKTTIIKDWRENGWTDLRRAIAVSSNVYFFSVGGGYDGQKGIGISNIEKYTRGFGFGKLTGINLSGEKKGNIPSPDWKRAVFGEEWILGDTYNSSIGQFGFQATPLQVARGLSAIANNGVLVNPTIIKGDNSKNKNEEDLPYSLSNLQIVREGLRLAVVDGTASGLSMPGLEVAAKTGTAELGFSKDLVNSWVMGYFPYKNPKYAFAVIMEKGPRANQIGATAIMRTLLEWMYANTPEYVR